MNILLTHGYFLADDAKEQKIMRPYPPLGILYISAYLEQHGMPNEVFDTTFSTKKVFREYLLEHQPTYLAIYVNLMTKLNVLETISFVRQSAQLQKTVIILGGPEVSHHAENFLQYGADYLVIGEGEVSTLELIECLDAGKPVYEVPGVACLNSEKKVVFTAERNKISNIDELPFPSRHKIDLSEYLRTWKSVHGSNALSISTMRGCPYTCKWCSRAVYGLSYRRRSPAKVAEEMAMLQKEYNPDTLWFVDDVFTISHKWLKGFAEALQKAGVKIPYECITRADRLNEEVVQLLKESGCFRVWIGAESGSQHVIDLMDRRVQVEQVREMIKLARKHQIQAGTFIMLGYPGETEADIEQTLHHLKDANPDHYTITLAYPIKGTALYDEVKDRQTTSLSWQSSTDRDIDFKRTYSRKYYDFAIRWVNSEVKLHRNALQSGINFTTAGLKAKSVLARMFMKWERVRATLL